MSVSHHLNWLRQIQPTCIKNIESHHERLPLSSSSCIHPIRCAVSTQAKTQSASNDCFIDEARVYSLAQACNNYRPNQLKNTAKAEEPVGEDLSYIYYGLILWAK